MIKVPKMPLSEAKKAKPAGPPEGSLAARTAEVAKRIKAEKVQATLAKQTGDLTFAQKATRVANALAARGAPVSAPPTVVPSLPNAVTRKATNTNKELDEPSKDSFTPEELSKPVATTKAAAKPQTFETPPEALPPSASGIKVPKIEFKPDAPKERKLVPVAIPAHLQGKLFTADKKPAKYALVDPNEVIGTPSTFKASVPKLKSKAELDAAKAAGTPPEMEEKTFGRFFGIPADDIMATNNKSQSITGQVTVVQHKRIMHEAGAELRKAALKASGFATGEVYNKKDPSHVKRLTDSIFDAEFKEKAQKEAHAAAGFGTKDEKGQLAPGTEEFNRANPEHEKRLNAAFDKVAEPHRNKAKYLASIFHPTFAVEHQAAYKNAGFSEGEQYDPENPRHLSMYQDAAHGIMKDWNLPTGRPETHQVRHHKVSSLGKSAIYLSDDPAELSKHGVDPKNLASLSSKRTGTSAANPGQDMLVSAHEIQSMEVSPEVADTVYANRSKKKVSEEDKKKGIIGPRGTAIIPQKYNPTPHHSFVSSDFKHVVPTDYEETPTGTKVKSAKIVPTVDFLDWHASLNAFRDEQDVNAERLREAFPVKFNKAERTTKKPDPEKGSKGAGYGNVPSRSTKSVKVPQMPDKPAKEAHGFGPKLRQSAKLDPNAVAPGGKLEADAEAQEAKKTRDRLNALFTPEQAAEFKAKVWADVLSQHQAEKAELAKLEKAGHIDKREASPEELVPPPMKKKKG
jgi:hypothetical protein